MVKVTVPLLPQENMSETDILAPLRFFCGMASGDLQVAFIEPEAVPEKERHLLVHDGDMTSRLARHHGAGITLDAQASSRMGEYLIRASVLRRRDTSAVVEFGAIAINLSGFSDQPRQWILDATVPLGGVLRDFAIPFTSHPRGYFHIGVDHRLAELLGGVPGQILYGRCNELRHHDGRVFAEVVEILPG